HLKTPSRDGRSEPVAEATGRESSVRPPANDPPLPRGVLTTAAQPVNAPSQSSKLRVLLRLAPQTERIQADPCGSALLEHLRSCAVWSDALCSAAQSACAATGRAAPSR